jgi:hypothetical protein
MEFTGAAGAITIWWSCSWGQVSLPVGNLVAAELQAEEN